jgi:hypothetical protein
VTPNYIQLVSLSDYRKDHYVLNEPKSTNNPTAYTTKSIEKTDIDGVIRDL